MTLAQLAECVATRTGGTMTHATLSRVETGRIGYTQRLLEAIAHCLNCHPADLIGRDPRDGSSAWGVANQISNADPDTRTRILAVIATLLETR